MSAPADDELKFKDAVSGRECQLVIPEGRHDAAFALAITGVRHPDCGMLADLAAHLDAFFCPACKFNGRISGAWALEMVERARGLQ